VFVKFLEGEMVKVFCFCVICILSVFEGGCMVGRYAAACIDVLNSANGKVELSYEKVENQSIIEQITGKTANIESSIEILPGNEFLLSESFPDFRQFIVKDDTDIVVRKITVVFQSNTLVGYIYMLCSIYHPNPYYAFENAKNSNIFLRRSVSRGGGPTTIEVVSRAK
jgi:hypothetical protein